MKCLRDFSTNVSLVCEGCYALYNLACLPKYHETMYRLEVIPFTIHNLTVLRTTQYFVPAMDLLRRLAGKTATKRGSEIIARHLADLLSVTRPGVAPTTGRRFAI